MTTLVLTYVHIVGAAVLLGTGLGIAFFLFVAVRSRDRAVIAGTLRAVVVADFAFTAPAVVAQPVTGFLLAESLGVPLNAPWIVGSLALYVLVGLCWLPVVAIQLWMHRLAAAAVHAGAPLPEEFKRLYRIWFILGWPAFLGVLAIIVLMVFKP